MSQITEAKHRLLAIVTGALAEHPDVLKVRVVPGPAEYTERHDFDALGFNVMVIVEEGDQGEACLDELLDPVTGLRSTLELDRTLGGLVSDLSVRKSSGYQTFPDVASVHQGGGEWIDRPVQRVGATWHVVCKT